MRPARTRARMLTLTALSCLALLAVPGCSEPPRPKEAFGPPVPPPRPPPVRKTLPIPLPPDVPPPPPAAAEAQAPQPVAEPPPQPPPPVIVTGLSAADLAKLFGDPAARVPTGTGERWTYRAGSCQVDVFMFPDVVHGGLTALDRRVSGATPDPDAEQACLRKLRDDHAI